MPPTPDPPLTESRTPHFAEVQVLLRVITHLLDAYPKSLLARLRKDVGELAATVAFCKRAYTASKPTMLYPLLNRQILKRIESCRDTLTRAHSRIAKLPYLSIPPWLEAGRILLGWFTSRNNEPDDILSIRLEIVEEIEALGNYLGSLK